MKQVYFILGTSWNKVFHICEIWTYFLPPFSTQNSCISAKMRNYKQSWNRVCFTSHQSRLTQQKWEKQDPAPLSVRRLPRQSVPTRDQRLHRHQCGLGQLMLTQLFLKKWSTRQKRSTRQLCSILPDTVQSQRTTSPRLIKMVSWFFQWQWRTYAALWVTWVLNEKIKPWSQLRRWQGTALSSSNTQEKNNPYRWSRQHSLRITTKDTKDSSRRRNWKEKWRKTREKSEFLFTFIKHCAKWHYLLLRRGLPSRALCIYSVFCAGTSLRAPFRLLSFARTTSPGTMTALLLKSGSTPQNKSAQINNIPSIKAMYQA